MLLGAADTVVEVLLPSPDAVVVVVLLLAPVVVVV